MKVDICHPLRFLSAFGLEYMTSTMEFQRWTKRAVETRDWVVNHKVLFVLMHPDTTEDVDFSVFKENPNIIQIKSGLN